MESTPRELRSSWNQGSASTPQKITRSRAVMTRGSFQDLMHRHLETLRDHVEHWRNLEQLIKLPTFLPHILKWKQSCFDNAAHQKWLVQSFGTYIELPENPADLPDRSAHWVKPTTQKVSVDTLHLINGVKDGYVIDFPIDLACIEQLEGDRKWLWLWAYYAEQLFVNNRGEDDLFESSKWNPTWCFEQCVRMLLMVWEDLTERPENGFFAQLLRSGGFGQERLSKDVTHSDTENKTTGGSTEIMNASWSRSKSLSVQSPIFSSTDDTIMLGNVEMREVIHVRPRNAAVSSNNITSQRRDKFSTPSSSTSPLSESTSRQTQERLIVQLAAPQFCRSLQNNVDDTTMQDSAPARATPVPEHPSHFIPSPPQSKYGLTAQEHGDDGRIADYRRRLNDEIERNVELRAENVQLLQELDMTKASALAVELDASNQRGTIQQLKIELEGCQIRQNGFDQSLANERQAREAVEEKLERAKRELEEERTAGEKAEREAKECLENDGMLLKALQRKTRQVQKMHERLREAKTRNRKEPGFEAKQ